MPRYVALLRGINVGGHRVKMDRLRELFREIGLTEVATFIASGNVLFTSPEEDERAIAARIEAHLEAGLGFPAPTFLRTTAELQAVSDRIGEDAAETVSVMLLATPAAERLRASLSALETPTDRFRFHGREIYWLIDCKVSESPLFGSAITRAMSTTPHTARNMTSIRKLLARHRPDGRRHGSGGAPSR